MISYVVAQYTRQPLRYGAYLLHTSWFQHIVGIISSLYFMARELCFCSAEIIQQLLNGVRILLLTISKTTYYLGLGINNALRWTKCRPEINIQGSSIITFRNYKRDEKQQDLHSKAELSKFSNKNLIIICSCFISYHLLLPIPGAAHFLRTHQSHLFLSKLQP